MGPHGLSPLSWRKVTALAALLFAAGQRPAPAQQRQATADIKPSDVAGTWEGKAMLGPRDSVVATYQLTATATRAGWTLKLPNRPPLPARIIAMGGDSIVTEVGPFESILRRGEMVTTRTTGHYRGDTMSGTIEARYASGDTLHEKTTATRKR